MHAVGMVADTALEVRVDADDLRMLRRNSKNLRCTSTDDELWVRFLYRLRVAVETVDLVVLALEGEGSVRPEAFHHRERLVEPRDPHTRFVERKATLLVVDGH